MTTARDVIILAMKEAGPLGVGQSLLAEDINDGFTLLQNMINQWQKRRWLVPSLFDIATVGNNIISNKMGDGQFWNTPRPDKIQAGYVVQLNTAGSNPVSLPLYPIFSYEDYARIAVKTLNTVPRYYFYDAAFPFGNLFIWPIPNNAWEIHMIIKSQLGFSTAISTGVISNAGRLYTDNVYAAVPLIGGSGISATANVTIVGGIITVFTLQNGGEGYKVNDVLGLDTTIVGNGVDFAWTVNSTTSNLDADIQLPPEYFEAMHYNLALRFASMYQIPPNDQTIKLARASLNTIKMANTQVPSLMMPPALRRGKAFNLFNAEGY